MAKPFPKKRPAVASKSVKPAAKIKKSPVPAPKPAKAVAEKSKKPKAAVKTTSKAPEKAKPMSKVTPKVMEKATAKGGEKAIEKAKPMPKVSSKVMEKAMDKGVEKAPEKAKPMPKVTPKVMEKATAKGVAKAPAKGQGKESRKPEIPLINTSRPMHSDGKPKKNQAGIASRELENFRDLLLAKRRELVGDMTSMEREALRSSSGTNLSNLPIHMADMGTDNYEQEFTLGLMEKDRNLLREINTALAKIQDGSYGICEGTGKPIAKARLDAQPWARFSIEHARKMERGPIRQV